MTKEKQLLEAIWQIFKDADNDELDIISKTYTLLEEYRKENGIND